MVVRSLLLAAALACASPAQACRLALALGFDVSSSVEPAEDQIQRQGMAAALRDPEVQEVLLNTPDPVAIAAFEWSGTFHQVTVLDWTLLDTPAAIETAAQTIATSPRRFREFPTAVGEALAHADELMQQAPACLFQTLDISGDGVQNEGRTPQQVYAEGALPFVTVNALAILGTRSVGNPVISANYDRDLIGFYRESVIQGPGAFVETADSFTDFAAAFRRKLLRELQVQIVGSVE